MLLLLFIIACFVFGPLATIGAIVGTIVGFFVMFTLIIIGLELLKIVLMLVELILLKVGL